MKSPFICVRIQNDHSLDNDRNIRHSSILYMENKRGYHCAIEGTIIHLSNGEVIETPDRMNQIVAKIDYLSDETA